MTRFALPLLAAALLIGAGCYKDDTTSPLNGKPRARVLLTDAPFPYDSVASVNVYVASIDASRDIDTTGGGAWVRVATPDNAFDLLTLQRGATAFLGEAELDPQQYRAIRMVIDADRSSIVYNNGAAPPVRWPWPGSGAVTLYALVEEPLDLSTRAAAAPGGAVIVIDFDVGRSFLYDYFGTREFTVLPWLRAVNSAATGTLAGTVKTDSGGRTQPVKNANITVCGSPACDPPNAYVVATGRSDDAGRYTVGFLRAGAYTVRVEQPDYPSLTSVGVGGTISLRAAVGNASGNPVSNPAVSWTSSNTALAPVSGAGDTASVTGRRAGYVTITAASGQLFDTLGVQVVGSAAPVATVTVVPGSANLAVGDSVGFRAELRDSTGTLLTDRAVSWYATDSTVLDVYPYGSQALVRPRGSGSVFLRATSEGKMGQATITVH